MKTEPPTTTPQGPPYDDMDNLAVLVKSFQDLLKRLTQRDVVNHIGYDEIIAYFRDHRPQGHAPGSVSGALLRIDTIAYDSLIQLFLDSDDRPIVDSFGVIVGRVVKFRECDDALKHAMAGNELVIFK